MDFLTIFFLALGLGMDCFAVSIAGGVTMRSIGIGRILFISLTFGAYHIVMPALGWLLGVTVRDIIQTYDHWVAFGLLTFVGGKMIYESLHIEEVEKKVQLESLRFILILAFATSIDALAVGIGFSILKTSIILPVIVIGAITFVMTFLGFFTGRIFGSFFENKVEFVGGVILLSIGIRILYEHMMTA